MTEAPLRLAAVDLGAASGRVLVGTFDGDRLAIDDVHRFPNVPVTLAGTLHWDFLRLFGEVTAGLRRAGGADPIASVGVDTWGVAFGPSMRAYGCLNSFLPSRQPQSYTISYTCDVDHALGARAR